MDAASWGYIGRGLFVLAGVNTLGRWSRTRPNRNPKALGAIRQPKIIPVVRWIVLPLGTLPLLICGIVPMLAAALLLTIYVNWYVVFRHADMVLRTRCRRIKRIRYKDLDKVQPSPPGHGSPVDVAKHRRDQDRTEFDGLRRDPGPGRHRVTRRLRSAEGGTPRAAGEPLARGSVGLDEVEPGGSVPGKGEGRSVIAAAFAFPPEGT
ncbi:hypothetical protein [Paeniglutamicibacter cryotolerans]|nr:hypothetical protein [Paeniglutamicibacter cryotolerans]